jgi:ABC-2 type transport system permease protein
MGSVYLLTLRQLSGRLRLLILAVLATLPVIMAALILRSTRGPTVAEFEQAILSAMLAGSITPLVVLASAAAAFANEVEDRTLANLTLSPLPRWQIAVPKLLASVTLAAPFIGLSAFLTAHVAFLGDVAATAAVTTSALVAVALYAAVFTWLGLFSTQAIGIGLLYIVLWEGLFAGFVEGVRLLSIRHHAIALMHALDARRFAETDHLAAAPAAVTALLVFAGFLLLTIRKLRNMDVP